MYFKGAGMNAEAAAAAAAAAAMLQYKADEAEVLPPFRWVMTTARIRHNATANWLCF